MKKISRYLMVSLLSLMAASYADDAATDGTHTHDGFYLNMMGGVGSLNFSETQNSTTLKIGGFSGHFGLKLGGAVTRNLILFGALDAFSAPNPTASVSGGASGSATLSNYTYSANMIGAGLAYYTDSNFFLSATVGYASGTLSYASGNTNISSSLTGGIGFNLNLGKEWWVSKDWGIGAALVGHYSAPKDSGTPVTQLYGGVAFTATYN